MVRKVLIIDDEEDARVVIMRHLKNAGVEDVLEAETGEEGIAMAERERPEVVITDTRMTGMDGYEVCRKIKENKDLDVKVIVCTAKIDAVDAVKARESGADDYCVKTINSQAIIDVIKKL